MRVTVGEVLSHFKTNPISTLVALLILLLFGLVLRFVYHIDIEMQRNVLIHDEGQHQQIRGAQLARYLRRSIVDLRQFITETDLSDDIALSSELLRQLCRSKPQYARVQLLPLHAVGQQDQLCVEDYRVDVDPGRLMPSVMSGVAVELLGRQLFSLDRQYVRLILPKFGARGEVVARWMVDLSLADLPGGAGEDREHGVANTVLLEDQYPWRGEQAKHDMAQGAGLLSTIESSEPGRFQNRYGLYLVHPLAVLDPQGQATVVNWRMLSWIPQQVFEQQQRRFLIHSGYVALGFMLLVCAMFFYSRRIIREQADTLSDLNRQRVFLDSLLNSSSDGMLTLAMDGVIQSCNTRAESLFGFRAGELLGRSAEHLLPSDYQVHDQDYRQIYQQLLKSGRSDDRQELVGIRREGEDFPVEVTYCQLKTDGAEQLLLIVREITGRKAAQQELDNLRMQYFQQEKIAQVGLLLSGILHEVGNPIAAIQGLVEEVLGDDDAAQRSLLSNGQRANLALVLQQADRIRTISQEVSCFASPHPSERGWLSLNAILEGTTKLLGYDKRWKGIELQMDLDSQLPAIEGVADQLTQVFVNLLVNAADAFDGVVDRQPRLRITTRRLAEGVLLVRIRDNGVGIDDKVMRHIFDSFYTTKAKGKGTGLGLSICEKLIEEHGGQLTLESIVDEGTEVRIYFESDLVTT